MKNLIFIIGPPRSGTTMLGNLLSKLDSVVYLEEPNSIWRVGKAHQENDFYTEYDINFFNSWYIKRWFKKKCNVNGLVIEKTPSNTLRLPFLRKLFPEARYIFLTRNSDFVVKSMVKKWLYEEDSNSTFIHKVDNHKAHHIKGQAKRFFESPCIDMPYYCIVSFKELLFHLGFKKRAYWGPIVPGLKHISNRLPPENVARYQFDFMQNCINEFKGTLNSLDYIDLNFDELINSDSNVTKKLSVFFGVPEQQLVDAFVNFKIYKS